LCLADPLVDGASLGRQAASNGGSPRSGFDARSAGERRRSPASLAPPSREVESLAAFPELVERLGLGRLYEVRD